MPRISSGSLAKHPPPSPAPPPSPQHSTARDAITLRKPRSLRHPTAPIDPAWSKTPIWSLGACHLAQWRQSYGPPTMRGGPKQASKLCTRYPAAALNDGPSGGAARRRHRLHCIRHPRKPRGRSNQHGHSPCLEGDRAPRPGALVTFSLNPKNKVNPPINAKALTRNLGTPGS